MHHPAHRARIDPSSPDPEEQRIAGPLPRQRGTALSQPSFQRPTRRHTERHDPLLVALAGHAHRAVVESDIADIQSDQLRHTHARGVQQLQHRGVTQSDGMTRPVTVIVIVAVRIIRRLVVATSLRIIEQTSGLDGVQHIRQRIRDLRGHQHGGRIRGDPAMFARPAEEAAYRHRRAGHARPRMRARRRRQAGAQIPDRDLPQVAHPPQLQGLQAFAHVTPVGAAGVLAQPAIRLEITEIIGERILEP